MLKAAIRGNTSLVARSSLSKMEPNAPLSYALNQEQRTLVDRVTATESSTADPTKPDEQVLRARYAKKWLTQ